MGETYTLRRTMFTLHTPLRAIIVLVAAIVLAGAAAAPSLPAAVPQTPAAPSAPPPAAQPSDTRAPPPATPPTDSDDSDLDERATPAPQPPGEKPHEGPHMPRWLERGIHHYGPISVFGAFIISGVGLHLSEDLILIPAGYLAANDAHKPVRLFWEFALWAYLGIVLGDTGWFLICRTFGTRFLQSRWFKRLMHPRRLLEIKYQIDTRGAVVLLAARFIPGVRTPVITMGGLLHMPFWKYIPVEASCVMITAPAQMGVGWLAAKAVSSAGVTNLSHQITIGVAVTVAFVVAMYLVHLWLMRRHAKHRPRRAPASWLRIYRAPKAPRPVPQPA